MGACVLRVFARAALAAAAARSASAANRLASTALFQRSETKAIARAAMMMRSIRVLMRIRQRGRSCSMMAPLVICREGSLLSSRPVRSARMEVPPRPEGLSSFYPGEASGVAEATDRASGDWRRSSRRRATDKPGACPGSGWPGRGRASQGHRRASPGVVGAFEPAAGNCGLNHPLTGVSKLGIVEPVEGLSRAGRVGRPRRGWARAGRIGRRSTRSVGLNLSFLKRPPCPRRAVLMSWDVSRN